MPRVIDTSNPTNALMTTELQKNYFDWRVGDEDFLAQSRRDAKEGMAVTGKYEDRFFHS